MIIGTSMYRYRDNSNPRFYPPLLEEFVVVKQTPCGSWIQPYNACPWMRPKFVLDSGKKRFAYPTKELAIDSYIIRKNKQIGIIQARLDNAKLWLDQAQKVKTGEIEPHLNYVGLR
jgi:hypothetical protein